MYLNNIAQSHLCAADDVEGVLQGVAKGLSRAVKIRSDRLETKVSLLLNLSFAIGWYE